MLGLSLVLLAAFAPQAPAAAQANDVPSFTIAIDQPVYTGQAVWVRTVDSSQRNIRYPFHAIAGDIGCNRLEVKRDGVLLTPQPQKGYGNGSGPLCGSAAPKGSPQNQLPLHVLYPFTTAGTYSVRWTQTSMRPQGQSDWLTFKVLESTPAQHEAWIKNLLANPPQDDGQLAGDFLPSLIAAAPDPRALDALVKYLYAGNRMVSGIASSALEYFPQPQVLRAVADSLVTHGPSDALAYFASYHRGWTRDDESRIVLATIPYLRYSQFTLSAAKQLSSSAPTPTSAALKLLRFIFYVQNKAWPSIPELMSYADDQILEAAPEIMADANVQAVQELAESLGAMPYSPRAHQFLLQIAQRPDTAAEQARLCLTWHPQPEDLAGLAAVLIAPGDTDPRGTDLTSIPASLIKAYGDKALPHLERAVADSPYVWVRVESAQQLALRNRPIGFQFLLDQLVQDTWPTNHAYKPELTRWVEQHFRNELPSGATEQQLLAFLRSKSKKAS
jgi:hypothetical protein